MRIIPTFAHGIADYSVGVVVISLPFIFDLQGSARWFFVGAGCFAILYSLMTGYELGAVRLLGIRFHLLLDVAFGLLMIAAPSLLELPSAVFWLSYVIGVLAMILAATTKTRAAGTAAR